MAITKVQDVGVKTTVGGSTTKTVTIGATGSGNALRLMIFTDSPAATINTPTGGGVTWTLLADVTNSDSSGRLRLYGGDNSTGGGTSVSFVVSNTYASYYCSVSEWSGLDTTPVTDPAATTNTGTSATVTSSSVTPTAGKSVLLLAGGGVDGGSHTLTNSPTGGFSALARDASGVAAWAYQIVASASGSYQTTWPTAVSYRPWETVIAGWDAAGGGGGGGATAHLLGTLGVGA